MVQALTHALNHLSVPLHRDRLWRMLQFNLVIRPAGRVLQLWRDARVLSLEMVCMLWRWRFPAMVGAAVTLPSCIWLLSPHDLEWLASMQHQKTSPVSAVSRLVSHWGDFLGFNMVLLFGVFSCSLLFRSRFLRLVVVASLLGTVFTGGTANVFRVVLGRARPSAKVAPGFYGPSLSSRLHSCPSGHTATAFGGSIPVAVALPPVGIPLMITAGGIAWSRLHNNAHHPTDIVLSFSIAIFYGVPLGLLARRMRRHRRLRLKTYAVLTARRLPSQASAS